MPYPTDHGGPMVGLSADEIRREVEWEREKLLPDTDPTEMWGEDIDADYGVEQS